jgi:hypothetical protein
MAVILAAAGIEPLECPRRRASAAPLPHTYPPLQYGVKTPHFRLRYRLSTGTQQARWSILSAWECVPHGGSSHGVFVGAGEPDYQRPPRTLTMVWGFYGVSVRVPGGSRGRHPLVPWAARLAGAWTAGSRPSVAGAPSDRRRWRHAIPPLTPSLCRPPKPRLGARLIVFRCATGHLGAHVIARSGSWRYGRRGDASVRRAPFFLKADRA